MRAVLMYNFITQQIKQPYSVNYDLFIKEVKCKWIEVKEKLTLTLKMPKM